LETQKNKYKKIALEVLIFFTVVNGVGWYIFRDAELAIIIQFILIYLFDLLFRKNLFGKRRKMIWNVAIGSLRAFSFLLSVKVSIILGAVMTLFTVIATRIMFFEDQDRTVQTVDELKQAYFIPIITNALRKLGQRAVYVMTE